MTAVSFSLRSFSFPRHTLLFVLTVVYLGDAICAAWGWPVIAPWWVGGSLLLTGGIGWSHGWRTAALGGCLFIIFAFANVQLWNVLHPQFSAEHLHQLSLPQKVTIDGRLFREPEHTLHRGRLYVEALRVWKNGDSRPATGRILI